MRKSIAAVALIRRELAGQVQWLAQWNQRWRCYYFVGGHKRPEESFRECVIREIDEELHLEPRVDFLLGSEPVARLEFDAFSENTFTDTHYIIELFEVVLTSVEACRKVESSPENRWLSDDEICRGRTGDDRPISGTMKRLLEAIDGMDRSREPSGSRIT